MIRRLAGSAALRLLPGGPHERKLLVFAYHNLLEPDDDSGCVGVTRAVFDRQVRWIARHFDVVGLRDGIDRCLAGELERPSACITFDDGYRTQMTIGATLLAELGITGSFFVTTGHLGDALLWNDRLRLFLGRCTPHERTLLLAELLRVSSERSRAGPMTSDDIEQRVKYLPIAAREALFDSTRELMEPERGHVARRMLDADDLRALRQGGFEVGAHTLEHPILKLESPDEARRQIESDLVNLERILGEPVTCFAFPNGMPGVDFGPRELDLLATSHVRIALTSAFGHFDARQDPLQVPRLSLRGSSGPDCLRTVVAAYRAHNPGLARVSRAASRLPTRRPRLQFISFHFAPSNEVGARRPTATAMHLADRFDVTVIRASKCEERKQESSTGVISEIRSVVSIPRSEVRSSATDLGHRAALRRLCRGFRTPDPDASSRRSSTQASISAGAGHPTRGNAPEPGLIESVVDFYRSMDGLLQNKKSWLARGAWAVSRATRRERPELVIASGPPMASLVLGAFAARVAGARLILDFRDPWYVYGEREHAELNWGRAVRFAGRLERGLLVMCVRHADAVTVASPGIREHLHSLDVLKSGTPVHVVRNGYEPEMTIETPPPHGRLQILYAGSLYWNRDPFPFLDALRRLVSLPDVPRASVKLRMLGECSCWNNVELAPWLMENGLDDVVRLEGTVSAEEVRSATVDSNLLVNFAQGQKRQIPAKSYEYIAARRRTLVLAEHDSDVAGLFREAGVGSVVEPGDVAGLDAALREAWMSVRTTSEPDAAVVPDIERFGRQVQLAAFERVVRSVLESDIDPTLWFPHKRNRPGDRW